MLFEERKDALIEDPGIEIISNKRRKKMIRLTMSERYKSKPNLVGNQFFNTSTKPNH
jgi:hypothetical protein